MTSWAAIPSRVASVYRFLRNYPQGLPKDEVKSLLNPRGLKGQSGEEAPTPNSTTAEEVIREAKSLGLLEEANGVLRIPADLPLLDDQGLMEHLESVLLHPKRAEKADQTDFTQALAWLLTLDPAKSLAWSEAPAGRVKADYGDQAAFGLNVAARFQNLVYWARYLGYAWRMDRGGQGQVVPDPTRALERHLRVILQPGVQTPLNSVMVALALRCPVLDGGVVRTEVEARLPLERRPQERTLSRTTSLALLELQGKNLVDFDSLADAQTVVLLDIWPNGKAVSHITLRG